MGYLEYIEYFAFQWIDKRTDSVAKKIKGNSDIQVFCVWKFERKIDYLRLSQNLLVNKVSM